MEQLTVGKQLWWMEIAVKRQTSSDKAYLSHALLPID